MRARFFALLGVAVATLALASCGADKARTFAQKVAMSDMYEIQAAQIAKQKSTAPAVKSFADKMITDHTATTEKLKSIVQAQKIDVNLPTKLDSDHQDLIDALNKATPADFDKTYAKQQVDAHQDAIKLFKSYAKNGDNDALKTFANDTLPTLQQHLSLAKALPQ